MIFSCDESQVDVRGVRADGAGVSAGESDETGLSPAGSPGVLDLPSVASGTDEQDTVVDSSAAAGHDTAPVGAPGGSIDGDGHGS